MTLFGNNFRDVILENRFGISFGWYLWAAFDNMDTFIGFRLVLSTIYDGC